MKNLRRKKLVAIDAELAGNKIAEFMNMFQKKGQDPILVKENIQQMMWKNVGVVRTAKKMKKGLKELERWKKVKLKVTGRAKMNEKLIAALDVKNMLTTCEMIIKSALHRKESRAAHYRSDYPRINPKWKKNIVCTRTKKGIVLATRRVQALPKSIKRLLGNKRMVKAYLE